MIDIPDNGQFQMPWQWGAAADIYGGLGNIMGPMWQAMQEQARTGIQQAGQEAVEQFGLGGLRQSTPLGQRLGQIGSQAMAGIMPQYWQLGLGAQQAAAGGYERLGQMESQLPQQVAMNQMQMAQMQQQMQQQAFQPQMQQFMWGRPESYLPQASQWGMGQYQQQPQMYQPSGFTQLLQGLGAGGGLASSLGWNPFGGGQDGGSGSPWGAEQGQMMGDIMQYLPFLFAAGSSVQYKKEINEISETDEKVVYEQIKKAPLFNYKYKFESDDDPIHLGLITERAPEELTLFNKKAIGLYEYISALHATIKTLIKKVEQLENTNA